MRRPSYRSWPNTEALKAHLAQLELRRILDIPRTTQVIDNLFRYFLAAPMPGTWIDRLNHERPPRLDKIPASTLYHLVSAFAELLRLEPPLRTVGSVDS